MATPFPRLTAPQFASPSLAPQALIRAGKPSFTTGTLSEIIFGKINRNILTNKPIYGKSNKGVFMKNLINWKIFFILLVACVISSMLLLPYLQELTSSETLFTTVALISRVVENLIMYAVAIFLGLFFAKKIGMGLPFLSSALEGKSQTKEFKFILPPSICLGALVSISIVLASIPFNKVIPELQLLESTIPVWKAFLASFYGGIAEEVLLRLFVLSLFIWITFIIKKTDDGLPTNFGIWLSIVLSAVLFGIGHLPSTSQIVPITGIVIFREILLNGIGGITFGWLYWRKGFESAIIAHFTADIVLHIIAPFVIPLFK